MADNAQEAQRELIEQALGDPRIARAVEAYDAVRPFVPLQSFVSVATTYSTSTDVTSGAPREG